MTSYKAARNLLIDIPSIEKTIFLIDRKDLDTQTTQAFQSYANNDVVDVDETDNVSDLIDKLKNQNQQVIVTTIQKLSIAVTKRLKENTPAYNRIKSLRVVFIVDECHRAVTPRTQRILSQFFVNSLWYGFTGTPRFDVNAYPSEGDLPRTTDELYGTCLHKYTVKETIHYNAVLGFQTEHLGIKALKNDESTDVNVPKMKESLADYNAMFGTSFGIGEIRGYNTNLNDRLSRKKLKFKSRDEQLDLVIVVNRLLTGFDAPCLSTVFIDRQPMHPHEIIQTFSRTNRLFDRNKGYGQIVTFQSPHAFKKAVDEALVLYSAGGKASVLAPDRDTVHEGFQKSLAYLRLTAETPEVIATFSKEGKLRFAKAFQEFDKIYSCLKAFTNYGENPPDSYGITQEEYDRYAAWYMNIKEEFPPREPGPDDMPTIDFEYELKAYSKEKIDYEYIISLIQSVVSATYEERQEQHYQNLVKEIEKYLEEVSAKNSQLGELMHKLWEKVKENPDQFKDVRVSYVLSEMRKNAIQRSRRICGRMVRIARRRILCGRPLSE